MVVVAKGVVFIILLVELLVGSDFSFGLDVSSVGWSVELELSGAFRPFSVIELFDFEDSADSADEEDVRAICFISLTARAAAAFGGTPSAMN